MADQTLAKEVNERQILRFLRLFGSASRADIARHLKVTPASVTRLVNGLTMRGLVREVQPGAKRGRTARDAGRPGVALALNPNAVFFLGVEIGIGILRYALIDLTANSVATSDVHVSRTITPEEVVDAIAAHIAMLEHDVRYAGRVHSVGVTVPGVVNLEGFVINLPILGWKGVDLLTPLQAAVDRPCFVENDAGAAAFGSVYTMPELQTGCSVFLVMGRGCGGAAVMNGRLLRGASGATGELGHMRIARDGAVCSCGHRGCFESRVGLDALARSYWGTDDLAEAQFEVLSAEVAERFSSGDPAAIASVADLTDWLKLGVVSLANIFNPSTIFLGGALGPVLSLIIEDIRQDVARGIVPGLPAPEIRLFSLEPYECAIGVAAIAHQRCFDSSGYGPYAPGQSPRRRWL
ncbi:ROK family transcriptional regulator [Shinella sp. AETb1-6]|uniref:ROK family transcriptional regulator n=1 Tax=Shinella sp. AETb1-6 TaxID=2692210 RepID=UPI0019296434|nr:ROK family transcriptional regulator [Shinella sp. AETb1-6]